MGRSRRAPLTREPDVPHSAENQTRVGPVLPAVRIAPAHDLAAAALAAPLLREAGRLARWVGVDRVVTARGLLRPADAVRVIADLEMAAGHELPGAGAGHPTAGSGSPAHLRSAGDVRELDLVWQAAVGAGLITITGRRACARRGALHSSDPRDVFAAWRGALDAVLSAGPAGASEELDGLATVLYAAGGPVQMDTLAEAFTVATHARRASAARVGGAAPAPPRGRRRGPDPTVRMSQALEVLADLGVVEAGLDEQEEQLTVALTALGVAGLRERLVAAGFCAPVAGYGAASDAAGLLAGLASYDAEDGEHEIAGWLAQRKPHEAAAELLEAAATSSPAARGAAFAIIDRLGECVIPLVRWAMANPILRPHAAIWLREQGCQADLSPAERAWLLVDLGAGLLEEADPRAVAADLLPDLPAAEQAELVRDLWQVSHPGLVGLLTTLTEHHPDPGVVKAARKAVFKVRSQHLGAG